MRFSVRWAVRPVLLVLVWLATAQLACAAELVRKAAPPDWVRDVAMPAPKPERLRQVADGLYYLIVDRQYRPGRPEVDYSRFAYQVTDRSGLESAGAINIDVDPASERLVLHRLRVIRGKAIQDRLGATPVRLLQREKSMEKGIYTGRRTAHIEVDDVRVGDIVEYAFSIETDDPLLGGHTSVSQQLAWGDPVGLTRLRVLWPHGRALTIKSFAGAPKARTSRLGAWDLYEWAMADADPVAAEEKVPNQIYQWPRVTLSSDRSWAEVVAWAQPLYSPPDTLTPAWDAKVARIAREAPAPADRITRALRLVQDEVRYLSLSIGAGGYRPRPPAEVIRSGYGDCKDKAVLLTAVLRRLGVEAVPALTDIEEGRGLADEPPRIAAFGHAIVRIRLDGRSYWVDATGTHEGGRFPDLAPLTYGYALPIAPGQSGLEAIDLPSPKEPTLDSVERYDVENGGKGTVALEVVTRHRANDADWMRSDLASNSPAELEKRYLNYYAEAYPGIRATEHLHITDDRDANLITVRERYEIPAPPASDLRKSFRIFASTLTDYKTPPGGERRLPLSLPFPIKKHHRIVLVTPGHKPPAPPKADISSKAFALTLKVIRTADTLTLDYDLEGKAEQLAPDAIEAYRNDARSAADAIEWYLDLTSTEGGTIGEEGKLLGIAVLMIFGALAIAGLVFGLRWGVRADDAYAAEGAFYPVSLRKFLVMAVATAGLYDFFWMWKCWRWAKARGGANSIMPFWRAFFSVIWLYPLFTTVNRRLGSRALPTWVGATGAIGYLGFAIAARIANLPQVAPAWALIGSLAFVCLLPAVLAVQRLNAASPEVVARNSRFSRYSLVAIAAGVLWWTLIIIGVQAGD